MPFEDQTPRKCKIVHVEWLDITGTSDSPELSRRWTLGHLLSTDFVSEGVECTVLGITWDEDGWSDYSTFPNSIVVSREDAK